MQVATNVAQTLISSRAEGSLIHGECVALDFFTERLSICQWIRAHWWIRTHGAQSMAFDGEPISGFSTHSPAHDFSGRKRTVLRDRHPIIYPAGVSDSEIAWKAYGIVTTRIPLKCAILLLMEELL